MSTSEEGKGDLVDNLKAGIDRLRTFELTSKVHCSKINSLLTSFFELRPMLDQLFPRKKVKNSRKRRRCLKELISLLLEFEEVCRKCSEETSDFQDFIVGTPIKKIFDKFFTIRQNSIAALRAIGANEAADVFVRSPDMLCNENHVDLKRLHRLLLQIKNCRSFADSRYFRENLSKRMQSMAKHGFYSEDYSDVIEVPEMNKFILSHDDIERDKSTAQIGNGRSATVSLGRIKGQEGLFAIKVLRCRSLTPPELESLQREITILASLSHPALVKLRGYTNEPPFCLVTDYVKNGSLFAFLREKKDQLSPTDRTLIALDVASGMSYIHDHKIMHRDLKSLNILLDENKRAKLCDFGLARIITYEPMSGLVGTAQWMAPEVLLSKPSYNASIDVYSYGIVLWELLTSKVPYEGIDLAVLPRLVVNDGLRPVIPEGTPPGLASLITSCWNANPMLRPTFHQITQLLTSPAYMFPGTDVSMIPRCNHRHAASTCDPLIFPDVPVKPRPTAKALSDGRMDQKFTGVDSNMLQMAEAIEKQNDENLHTAIANILAYLKHTPNVSDPDNFVSDLMSLAADAPLPQKVPIVRLLAESLSAPEVLQGFFKEGGPDFLCTLLETRDPQVVDVTLGIIEKHSSDEMYPIAVIRCLLSFCDFSDASLRIRALNNLLMVAQRQREFLCTIPAFISHLLDYSVCPLPDTVWENLLNTAADLLSGINNMPDCLTDSLSQLLSRVPERFWEKAGRCISIGLRYPEMMEAFPEQYWALAKGYFSIFKTFFISFLKAPPKEPRAMIESLMEIARTEKDALVVLIRFSSHEQCAKEIVSLLPIRNRVDDTLLLRLYSSLIEVGYEEAVYQQNEFYSVVLSLISVGISDYLCQLLRSSYINIEIARSLGYVDSLSRAIMATTDHEVLWNLLRVVHKWCTRYYIREFEVLIPHLNDLLRSSESSARLGSFLCLTVFAEHTKKDIDTVLICKVALYYVSHESELIQELAKTFLEKNMESFTSNIAEFATLFIKYYKFTPSSVEVAKMILETSRKSGVVLQNEDMVNLSRIVKIN